MIEYEIDVIEVDDIVQNYCEKWREMNFEQ